MLQPRPALVMRQVTDPQELAASRERALKYQRNWQWFQAHIQEIGETCRGKCICIAGEELFSADTPQEAIALAEAAHPDDEGMFAHYIPRDKLARIYAHTR